MKSLLIASLFCLCFAFVLSKECPDTVYKWEEVFSHNSKQSLWLAINGNVYDVTKWIPHHPGGIAIIEGREKDATSLFREIHPPSTSVILNRYCIGKITSDPIPN
eukprot:TRINITY_DN1217_c0_g1_i2.p1 TRINITY_DN1217_c0_g1~~TRINITY_DN1217_c0_g1_i2.p1  ORF type:complete len:105 (+),score=21.89 TRINITY_DN1217_c0_g1_i2:114-428(+)